MIVNPARGALVRDPTNWLPLPDGADIDPTDSYYARALADGDLVEVTPKPARRPAGQNEDRD